MNTEGSKTLKEHLVWVEAVDMEFAIPIQARFLVTKYGTFDYPVEIVN